MDGAPIKDVSDTAFWVAQLRAEESERPDALFHDPLAGRLAGEHGRKIAAAMPMSRWVGWSVSMRTCIIDEYIHFAIRAGVDTILNLGAGLDARPYRMDLPAALQWIEADYPQILDYKERVLAAEQPRCRLSRMRADLGERAQRQELLAAIGLHATKTLILTEGVLPYLSVEEVAALAHDLRAWEPARYWVVDYFHPAVMRFRRRGRMGRALRNAAFRFAPPDWFGFFERHGWKPREIRYLAEQSRLAARPVPMPPWVKVAIAVGGLFAGAERADPFRKLMGYVLLEPS
jgi:methyltransferase (TIGR00027 family)